MLKKCVGIIFCFCCSLQLLNAQVISSSGGGGAYTISNFPGNFSGYYDGLSVIFRANHSLPGASATLNINGAGAKTIVNTANNPLSVNDIIIDQIVSLVFDQPNDQFQMISTSGNVGGGGGVSGAGTASYLARWAAANTLGNSVIWDDGAQIGIGNTSPASLFSVGPGSEFQVTSSGNVLGPNGTASAPVYSFGGDPNTGIYNPGADQIMFATGGFNRLSITNVQNLALNTGSAASPPWSFGTNSGSGMYSPGAGMLAFSAGGAENIRLISGGNVGIGTNSPASLLSVGSGASSPFQVNASGNIIRLNNVVTSFPAANLAGVLTNDGTGTLSWAPAAGTNPWLRSAPNIYLANKMDSVGIGTQTPSAKLHVVKSNNPGTGDAIHATISGTSGNAIYGFSNGTNGRAGLFQISNGLNPSNALQASTTGTGRAGHFQIANAASSSDALFVTTNGSGAALNVSNTNTVAVGTKYGVYSTAVSAAGMTGVGGYFTSTGAGTNYAGIFEMGNVGIGTASPVARLEIALGALAGNDGLKVVHAGTSGGGGNFELTNSINGSPAIFATTVGTGRAAEFRINNSGNNSDALNVVTNGSNSKAVNISHTGSGGAGTDYGIYATNTGAGGGSENVAGYFSASGATNNYAALFDQGNVGIGTTAPTSNKLEVHGASSLFYNPVGAMNVDIGGSLVGGSKLTVSGLAVVGTYSTTPGPNTYLGILDGHIQTQGERPTVTLTGNISSGSVSTGTDVAGVIQYSVAGSGAIGTYIILNFNKPYDNPPIVVITPQNTGAALAVSQYDVYVTTTTTGFSIRHNRACTFGSPPLCSNSVLFYYMVIDR